MISLESRGSDCPMGMSFMGKGVNPSYTPVFIIGGSRTGSELLKRILFRYADIDMLPEAFLLCPKWLHKDFAGNAKKYAGGLGSQCDLDALVDLMFSKKLYGMFWKKIDALDRDLMKEQLVATDRSLKEIFGVIMELHAKANNKTVQGAKFPLHYSFAELLVRWFPGCKIIHTARDPRAIYSSQSNKYTRREYSFIRNAWIRTQQVAHICIQTEWTSRIHEKLKDGDNYMLSRYEDLVLNPAEHMKRVCRFLGVEYRDEMAAPRVFSNSSFQETRGTSGEFHKKSIYAWKGRISPLTASFIGFLNGRAMRRFGYSVTESEN